MTKKKPGSSALKGTNHTIFESVSIILILTEKNINVSVPFKILKISSLLLFVLGYCTTQFPNVP